MNDQDQKQKNSDKVGQRQDRQNTNLAQQIHVSDVAKQASEQGGGKSPDNQK